MQRPSWDYCEKILPQVSRTFALNIKILKGELYRTVLVSYLVCRILDTIEDSPETPFDVKEKMMGCFLNCLRKGVLLPMEWHGKVQKLSGSNPDLNLLAHSNLVIEEYRFLPEQLKKVAMVSYETMMKGMLDYQKRFIEGEQVVLQDRKDLEKYCYYVAGTVGELLTECFIQVGQIPDHTAEEMRKRAVAFGLGLQMVNIAKDVLADAQRGWRYIPQNMESDSLIQLARDYLDQALEFTLFIPRTQWRIRLFCLWPLWMAMQTLIALKKDRLNKISREQVKKIMKKTTLFCPSNYLLKRDFKKMKYGLGVNSQ